MGVNSLQSYQLSSNKHFSLAVQSRVNGVKSPELVLEQALDREEEAMHRLVLTAVDGGDPLRSGQARWQPQLGLLCPPADAGSVWRAEHEGLCVCSGREGWITAAQSFHPGDQVPHQSEGSTLALE